jgi:hypothetical protein
MDVPASWMSSKPTTETSSGTLRPASLTARIGAQRHEVGGATTAVGRLGQREELGHRWCPLST